jgi:hypothetical protein
MSLRNKALRKEMLQINSGLSVTLYRQFVLKIRVVHAAEA